MDDRDGRAARRARRCSTSSATIDAAADRRPRWPPCSAGCSAPASAAAPALYVDTDSKDSTRYLLHLSQSGLGLPDESYYRDAQHAEILAAYPRPHRADVRAGLRRGAAAGEWEATAARIVALETKIAAAHWDVVKRRDADLTYNLRTFADLPAEAPGFDWAGWVTAIGATPEAAAEVVVRQPDSLTAFAALWAERGPRGLEAVGCAGGSSARAPSLLTDDLVAENFDFYGRTLSAAPRRSATAGSAASRWSRT